MSSASNVLIFHASFATTNETNNFLVATKRSMDDAKISWIFGAARMLLTITITIISSIEHFKLYKCCGTHSIPMVHIFYLSAGTSSTLGFRLLYGNFVKMHVCCLRQLILRLASLSKYGENVNNSDFPLQFVFRLVFVFGE